MEAVSTLHVVLYQHQSDAARRAHRRARRATCSGTARPVGFHRRYQAKVPTVILGIHYEIGDISATSRGGSGDSFREIQRDPGGGGGQWRLHTGHARCAISLPAPSTHSNWDDGTVLGGGDEESTGGEAADVKGGCQADGHRAGDVGNNSSYKSTRGDVTRTDTTTSTSTAPATCLRPLSATVSISCTSASASTCWRVDAMLQVRDDGTSEECLPIRIGTNNTHQQ